MNTPGGENENRLKLHMMESTHRDLNSFRVQNIMLLCSLYDYYTVEEDGMLEDMLSGSGVGEAGRIPSFYQVPEGSSALRLLQDGSAGRFDMVICMSAGDHMSFEEFTERAREIQPGIPVAVLTHNTEELRKVTGGNPGAFPYRLFTWMGSGEMISGIIQLAENTVNAGHDCGEKGVPCMMLVEDDVAFYSRYLHQGMKVVDEKCAASLSRMKSITRRKLKARAKTKLLLATSMEEAVSILESYGNSLVAVITDMRFSQNGDHSKTAGISLIESIREYDPNIPVVLQTSETGGGKTAEQLGVAYIDKGSPTLISDLSAVLTDYLDFEDLRFTDASGKVVRTVSNIHELGSALEKLPPDVVDRCWNSGRITRWLRIQTELELVSFMEEAAGAGKGERPLLRGYRLWQAEQRRGYVTPYSRSFHEENLMFSRLGNGSMGGKGRGLAFIDRMLAANLQEDAFRKVSVAVPNTVIITTEFFDKFVQRNDLHRFAIECNDDDRIHRAFQKASLPATILGDLRDYIKTVTTPLAVRSSSLLEDAMYQPFAGIYATKMLPNNSMDLEVRFRHLVSAIKFVYASTFMQSAKSYIKATNHRVEEEKMAVLLQKVEGSLHRNLFYPHFSGVGRSYDFYPAGSAKPEDGVVNVALGLGKAIVDGGMSLRFTPAYPRVLPQFGTMKDMMDNSQKRFFAVEMDNVNWGSRMNEDQYITEHDLKRAEKDGTLEYLGSTYDAMNERVMDGITRTGPRVVSFAHILKSGVFPLPRITDYLLKMGEESMGCPVEIEFAVTLGEKRPLPAHFSLLQIRPMVVNTDLVSVDPENIDPERLLCITETALGNGTIQEIRDVVFVKREVFTASKTRDIVKQVDLLNRKLFQAERPYILIGPGRWGSSDPWLGIPVNWNQISGARVIVEASQPNMNIDPSQGSHFFQNMTSLGVVYFTVPHNRSGSMINWDRLEDIQPEEDLEHVRHVRLKEPVSVMVDGRTGTGAMVTG